MPAQLAVDVAPAAAGAEADRLGPRVVRDRVQQPQVDGDALARDVVGARHGRVPPAADGEPAARRHQPLQEGRDLRGGPGLRDAGGREAGVDGPVGALARAVAGVAGMEDLEVGRGLEAAGVGEIRHRLESICTDGRYQQVDGN